MLSRRRDIPQATPGMVIVQRMVSLGATCVEFAGRVQIVWDDGCAPPTAKDQVTLSISPGFEYSRRRVRGFLDDMGISVERWNGNEGERIDVN